MCPERPAHLRRPSGHIPYAISIQRLTSLVCMEFNACRTGMGDCACVFAREISARDGPAFRVSFLSVKSIWH